MYGLRNRRKSGEELSDMDSEPATPTRGRRRSAEPEAGDKSGQKKKKRPVVRPTKAKAKEIVNPLDTSPDSTGLIDTPRQQEAAKTSVLKRIPATKPKDQSDKSDPSKAKEKAKEKPSEIPTATVDHLNSSEDSTTSSDDSEDSLTSVE